MQSGAGQLRQLTFAILAALLCASPAARADPSLSLVAKLTWHHPANWFGGFSGMEISADGTRATLITDRAMLVRARLLRKNGNITGLSLSSFQRLKDARGRPKPENDEDTEGLAIGPDGTAYVSFETRDRVDRLDAGTGRLFALPRHADFDAFPVNTGLEALAVHPDGRVMALPEGKPDAQGMTPLYTLDKGRWSITHRIPLGGPFRPVGADFDAKGRLYLLERAISPLGFRTRLRRVDLAARPIRAETLLTTFPALHDNLEALSVWTDSRGQTRLTMISDDNFLAIQDTQIVEYLLRE